MQGGREGILTSQVMALNLLGRLSVIVLNPLVSVMSRSSLLPEDAVEEGLETVSLLESPLPTS